MSTKFGQGSLAFSRVRPSLDHIRPNFGQLGAIPTEIGRSPTNFGPDSSSALRLWLNLGQISLCFPKFERTRRNLARFRPNFATCLRCRPNLAQAGPTFEAKGKFNQKHFSVFRGPRCQRSTAPTECIPKPCPSKATGGSRGRVVAGAGSGQVVPAEPRREVVGPEAAEHRTYALNAPLTLSSGRRDRQRNGQARVRGDASPRGLAQSPGEHR